MLAGCDQEEAEEARGQKRLKRTYSMVESVGSNSPIANTGGFGCGIRRCSSTSSLNTLPRLHFRDHIWMYTQRYLAAEAVKEEAAASAVIGGEEDGSADGMRLVQLLVACAEAMACRDKAYASSLLSELRSQALVFGTSFQRVASCFVQALADRLSLLQPLGTSGFVSPAAAAAAAGATAFDKKEEALRLAYEICPYIEFGHFVANTSILEAFEGESFVHVVDLGMSLGLPRGHQWRWLIQSLAGRPGRPPRRLRITAIGLSAKKFRSIGDELEAYALHLGINLDILQLHRVVKESRGALNSVLQMIRQLSPKVLVLVEQDSSHNGPFFLGRFMEALHYYSAIFDSLDAMFPKYDTRRAKVEQFYFAEEIKNIVSCEGPARVERHERVDQWRRRMSRAGFQSAPIKMMAQAKQWLGKNKVCQGFTVVEEKGCLVLGWNSKPIVAASCWKC
ncbi:GRAS domain-containing protein [Psidium guajava]|nr:GRAS domain-containing protein [Psidium guajava]